MPWREAHSCFLDQVARNERRGGSASGFRRGPGRALGFFEKALRRLGSRYRVLAPCLLRASPLTLAGTLTSSRFRRHAGGTLNAVARCQTNLKLDNLIPDGIGALMVGDGQQFAQATSRIRCLRFIAYRFCRRLLAGRSGCHGLLNGLFFVHLHIIARIIGSVPVLLVEPDVMWGFCLRTPRQTAFNLKNSVEPQRHREHRGKTKCCAVRPDHPMGERLPTQTALIHRLSLCLRVSVVGFLGLSRHEPPPSLRFAAHFSDLSFA